MRCDLAITRRNVAIGESFGASGGDSEFQAGIRRSSPFLTLLPTK